MRGASWYNYSEYKFSGGLRPGGVLPEILEAKQVARFDIGGLSHTVPYVTETIAVNCESLTDGEAFMMKVEGS